MPGCQCCSEGPMEEIPMNRFSNPIPPCCRNRPDRCLIQSEGIDHILTALAVQNQLLIDLLGAVNGLTAALLSERTH